jgi:hypothetical protein
MTGNMLPPLGFMRTMANDEYLNPVIKLHSVKFSTTNPTPSPRLPAIDTRRTVTGASNMNNGKLPPISESINETYQKSKSLSHSQITN